MKRETLPEWATQDWMLETASRLRELGRLEQFEHGGSAGREYAERLGAGARQLEDIANGEACDLVEWGGTAPPEPNDDVSLVAWFRRHLACRDVEEKSIGVGGFDPRRHCNACRTKFERGEAPL